MESDLEESLLDSVSPNYGLVSLAIRQLDESEFFAHARILEGYEVYKAAFSLSADYPFSLTEKNRDKDPQLTMYFDFFKKEGILDDRLLEVFSFITFAQWVQKNHPLLLEGHKDDDLSFLKLRKALEVVLSHLPIEDPYYSSLVRVVNGVRKEFPYERIINCRCERLSKPPERLSDKSGSHASL